MNGTASMKASLYVRGCRDAKRCAGRAQCFRNLTLPPESPFSLSVLCSLNVLSVLHLSTLQFLPCPLPSAVPRVTQKEISLCPRNLPLVSNKNFKWWIARPANSVHIFCRC